MLHAYGVHSYCSGPDIEPDASGGRVVWLPCAAAVDQQKWDVCVRVRGFWIGQNKRNTERWEMGNEEEGLGNRSKGFLQPYIQVGATSIKGYHMTYNTYNASANHANHGSTGSTDRILKCTLYQGGMGRLS